MVIEALQSYAQLASGLTKTTREKAMATARGLLDQAGLGDVAADATDRVSKLADELIATSKANRQLLTHFVDVEVAKAVGRLGLAKADELEDLRAEVAALRALATSAAATSSVPGAAADAPGAPSAAAAPTKRPAKRAPAKKTPTARKATAAKKSAAKKSAPAAPAQKRPAKKATAKTTPAATTPAATTPGEAPASSEDAS